MRAVLALALIGAALLPVPTAVASTPMKAVIVHLDPLVVPRSTPARAVAGRMERDGEAAQAGVLAQLVALGRAGHVRHVRSLWIANAVALTADDVALAALRARPDVRSVETDAQLAIRLADAGAPASGVAASSAPELWAHGVDGTGVTVATLDTGVDLTHPALAGRYRGGGNSWFDPYGEHTTGPVDLHGHGTQVMGVIVAGNGIGMAPGASFIAARVFNDAGVSTDSGVHLAFQWLLDPDGNPATDDAPDVVNASWGAQLATCDREFEPDLQALRAAHILPVFAAGNDGPAAPSDTSPGNLPEAFAVGAEADATTIAPFSSIGPSRCDGGQFPSLVAAGTGIRSTDRFGFDATGLAGTSFAAPHVAGALALLLQVAPQLAAGDQASLLTRSAHDLGTPGSDASFGAGSLNVAAAARLLSPTLDFSSPSLSGAAFADSLLRVHAVDDSSAIAAGELWVDADPGIGAGQAMVAADGSFDSQAEDLVAVVAGLGPGDHTIGFRARDAAGNWSSASLLAVSIAATAASAPPLSAAPAAAPAAVVAPPLASTTALASVASDGFEHGLAAWPVRAGTVAAIRGARISGRLGLRVGSTAGARAFVERRLPQPAARVELAFAARASSVWSAGAWTEIAAIDAADGSRLVSVELRASGSGPVRLRLTASRGPGAPVHSRWQPISRRRATIALALDPTYAALSIDGRQRASLRRGFDTAKAAAVALGARRPAPPRATGYLDIDNVTVRSAPDAT
jgi:subtilisin family serine protease